MVKTETGKQSKFKISTYKLTKERKTGSLLRGVSLLYTHTHTNIF